jgi:hypothetical protein
MTLNVAITSFALSGDDRKAVEAGAPTCDPYSCSN